MSPHVMNLILIAGFAGLAAWASRLGLMPFLGAQGLLVLAAWISGWAKGRADLLDTLDAHVRHARRSYEAAMAYERARMEGRAPDA